jgi:large subunit ribosomal protein L5
VTKITLNMGVGDAKVDAKALDSAMDELATIAGQRSQMRRATEVDRRLQAPRGDADRRARDAARRADVRVPRPARLDRAAAHPRLPRARPGSFDGRGNYSLGVASRSSFPRSTTTTSTRCVGSDIAITTSATDDEAARALLRGLGMPFADDRRDEE